MSRVMPYQPQWIREDFVDFMAEKINPLWAWKKVKAKLVNIEMLGADFYQLELQPNNHFNAKAFLAGQSLLVTVQIAGVHQQRHYSIVKITETGNIVIAVKRQGLLSNALTRLALGSVLEVSQTQVILILMMMGLQRCYCWRLAAALPQFMHCYSKP